MNGKEGVIRLGRSKSLKGRNKSIISNQYDPFSTSNSFKSENIQIQEKSICHQSFQYQQKIAPRSREKILITNQNLLNCYPPSSRQEIVKQRISSPERNLLMKHEIPIKKVMVGSQNSIKNEKEEMSNEGYWRRIKMLEERVQELHEEKQIGLFRAYEEERKVKEDYTLAKNEFLQIQNEKNQQIVVLQDRVKQLENEKVCQNVPISDYEDEARMMMSTLTVKVNEELMKENRRLEDENKKMRDELNEMKMAIVNTTAAIEENNHSIIDNYEFKITLLQDEIEEFKRNRHNESTQEEYFDNNCQEVLGIMKKLAEKDIELAKITNDLAEKENECEIYRNSEESNKLEVRESAEKLLKLKEDTTLREKELITRINDLSNHSQQNQEKYEGACYRILCLEEEMKKNRLISEEICEKPKVEEPCRRCQQLIKTLGKLNQKSFSEPS